MSLSYTVRGLSLFALCMQAGFVIVGVTNTSELCMWWESNNKVYGRTNNAYDHRRIVGGSSGPERRGMGGLCEGVVVVYLTCKSMASHAYA